MSNLYNALLESKRHTSSNYGIPVSWLPDGMFDFQQHVLIAFPPCTDLAQAGGRAITWLDNCTPQQKAKTFPGIARAMAEQWG